MNAAPVPTQRVQALRPTAANPDGEYVLYWMIAFRRTEWNFALQRAVEWSNELNKPLLIFEPLRAGYRWASDRLHRFVIDGMLDNGRGIERLGQPNVAYFPYVEPVADAGKGLLEALAARACVVVTDDFPSFFLPRMVKAAVDRLTTRVECVDSNGLLPIRATNRGFTTAHSFRAFLQKELPRHLGEFPEPAPLKKLCGPAFQGVPAAIARRWPPASERLLRGDLAELRSLRIDHDVPVVTNTRGGAAIARVALTTFLANRLDAYVTIANQPDDDARSGLSPYLHFGHISPHELFHKLMSREDWNTTNLAGPSGGKKAGWWGVSPGAEAWLDEFITWRELGYNMTTHAANYDRYESLPQWSRATLEKHARDPREHSYYLAEFAAAQTHDSLWNAAQRQLVREGRIHNYLRMLWGKKILEWSGSPQQALDVMIELNNKYALDGRNPNSYSGIFWVLGRYDRPWGPERPIYGTVRYMSSDNTARKLRVKEYLRRYAD